MIFKNKPEEEIEVTEENEQLAEQESQEQEQPEDPNDKFDCLKCKDLPELKGSYIRLNADFENYKKRVAKDQVNWVAAGQGQLLLELLEIVDNFDRALAEHEREGHSEELDAWLQGFELIRKSLYKFLEKNNVAEITEVTTFDPTLHEAVTQIDSPNHETDQVVDVIQRGFKFKDSVLRPAKVVVAK